MMAARSSAAVERELRGLLLDEYLADYEQRSGPLPAEELQRAGEAFARVLDQPGQWPTTGRPRKGGASAHSRACTDSP